MAVLPATSSSTRKRKPLPWAPTGPSPTATTMRPDSQLFSPTENRWRNDMQTQVANAELAGAEDKTRAAQERLQAETNGLSSVLSQGRPYQPGEMDRILNQRAAQKPAPWQPNLTIPALAPQPLSANDQTASTMQQAERLRQQAGLAPRFGHPLGTVPSFQQNMARAGNVQGQNGFDLADTYMKSATASRDAAKTGNEIATASSWPGAWDARPPWSPAPSITNSNGIQVSNPAVGATPPIGYQGSRARSTTEMLTGVGPGQVSQVKPGENPYVSNPGGRPNTIDPERFAAHMAWKPENQANREAMVQSDAWARHADRVARMGGEPGMDTQEANVYTNPNARTAADLAMAGLPWQAAQNVLDAQVSAANGRNENMVRARIYSEAIRQGKTREEAAAYADDVSGANSGVPWQSPAPNTPIGRVSSAFASQVDLKKAFDQALISNNREEAIRLGGMVGLSPEEVDGFFAVASSNAQRQATTQDNRAANTRRFGVTPKQAQRAAGQSGFAGMTTALPRRK